MFQLGVRKISVRNRVRALHRIRKRKWKEQGAVGYAPKEWQTVEDIVLKGMSHRSVREELIEEENRKKLIRGNGSPPEV